MPFPCYGLLCSVHGEAKDPWRPLEHIREQAQIDPGDPLNIREHVQIDPANTTVCE